MSGNSALYVALAIIRWFVNLVTFYIKFNKKGTACACMHDYCGCVYLCSHQNNIVLVLDINSIGETMECSI